MRVRGFTQGARPRRATVRALIGLIFLASCSFACRSVEPWERGALAAPRMQSAPHAANDAFVDHVRQSREAAAPGAGSSGGGCGCY